MYSFNWTEPNMKFNILWSYRYKNLSALDVMAQYLDESMYLIFFIILYPCYVLEYDAHSAN